MAIPETVSELLAPVVTQFGVELIDVEWSGSTLRVVLDAEGGVSTDQLASANRIISPLLDQHDPIPGRYTLEVSSPGVERPLKRLEHYERAVGEDVVVKTLPGCEPRRYKGRLLSSDGEGIEVDAIEIDGVDLPGPEAHRVLFADIDKARTVFNWGPAPKPHGPKKSPKKSPKKQGTASKKSTAPKGAAANKSAANNNAVNKHETTRKNVNRHEQ